MNGTIGPVIRIENMSKVYRMGEVTVTALKDVSLELYPDQVTIILGPSGCGKTTLLNQIGGIDTPTSGRLWVDGHQVQSLNQRQLTRYRQKNIGFIFQFFNLIPNLTARENIEFVLEYIMDISGREAHRRSQELLTKVGLGERGDHYPYQLSGGEQQRVSIARALSKEPKILLADEPTGELDYTTGKMILSLLTSFACDGRAVLIVTHNKELAKIGNRVLYLKDGRVVREVKDQVPTPVERLEW
ncbi:MAG: ABC transporter ATP-binding protein [Candidatus Thermoplasmatota archaeon]|jgi:putative ABC transport system ATP-binding protein|nr:ABC transporter ATP-binding protein [Candidatus Thermoplasmatota archaeon]